jgi:lysophospholipid acyltransferase (LPLAT)-like uncharacterized protein
MRHWMTEFGGFALATFIRNWMRSLRYQSAFYQPQVDPVHPAFQGPAIYIFWHEYIPFMFYLRGHCDLAMLVSQHRDAELLSRAAGIMGFELVRGSSRRGAITALRGLIRRGQGMNLTLTPDGPKGPRRRLAPGCLYLSAKLGIPLVPLGLGYARPWRNKRAWDHFAVPRPWSRAQAIIGPAIQIPADFERESLEPWRLQVESILNQLTTLAENVAVGRQTLLQSYPIYRSASPLYIHRSRSPINSSLCDGPPSLEMPALQRSSAA